MLSIPHAYLRLFESALSRADWVAARMGRASSLPDHLIVGQAGERAAFFHLRREGFIVVARRFHSALRPGDIDLIAWEGDVLCFVEVKTRSSHAVATAESAVDEHKRETLRKLARLYLRHIDEQPQTRFDILSIYLSKSQQNEFELFRGAFDW